MQSFRVPHTHTHTTTYNSYGVFCTLPTYSVDYFISSRNVKQKKKKKIVNLQNLEKIGEIFTENVFFYNNIGEKEVYK